MKIKTKKQLNLPQLIEWAWENGMRGETFLIDSNQEAGIHFDGDCDFKMHNADFIRNNDLFTVEVEEEITEDTVLSKLVERWKHDDEGDETFRYVEHDDKSINIVLFANPESVEVTHFYAEIDGELELIWRDGELVE